MSWGDIDLSTTPSDNEILPEGVFNFVVTGAGTNKFDAEKVDVYAKVLDGEFKGRPTIFSYPDPAKQEWSAGVFVRLAKSMGVTINKGEKPVDVLKRAVTAGTNKFTAPIKHRDVEYDGLTETKSEVNIMKVKAYRG